MSLQNQLKVTGLENYETLKQQLFTAEEESFLVEQLTIRSLLGRFLDEKITAEELSQFAELLDGNEAVDYESEQREIIADVLFDLSSPEINGEITHEKVRSILDGFTV